MIPDGAGGAIVAWQDVRGGTYVDIYAQRIYATGYGQWTANGVAVCTGKTALALGRIIADGAGGAIIVWSDTRNGTNDVFAQRIDGNGAAQWTANGVTICAASGSQINPTLTSDGANGAIVAWQDNRGGTYDIYAQRVSAAGAVQWTADGIAVCSAVQSQMYPQIISDGLGGAVIAWQDHRNAVDDDIYAQRVDASGGTLWTANGVAISATTGSQQNCRIIPGASGEAIIAWIDYRLGASNGDIYVQKVNASGAGQWAANGATVCAAAGNQTNVQLIMDGADGAVATWEDARSGASNIDVYARRIKATGAMGWVADGVAVCTYTANQQTPQLAPDGFGGALVAWKDMRGSSADVYAQRVDAAGHTVTATLLQSYSAALSGGDVEITWTLSEAGDDIEFFVLRAEERSKDFGEIPSDAIEREGLSFSFVDRGCEPGASYRYRVDVRDGSERKVLFETGPVKTPALPLTLCQNIPNPFNPSTTIKYFVPERCRVALEVYDVTGNLVRRLTAGDRERGFHTAMWNGLDGNGNSASSGVYYCRLRAGKETLSRKMILLR
jgi:hypothetical protein